MRGKTSKGTGRTGYPRLYRVSTVGLPACCPKAGTVVLLHCGGGGRAGRVGLGGSVVEGSWES